MTTREERKLLKREAQLLDALAARRSTSQRQADMATGRTPEVDLDDGDNGSASTSERQAAMAIRAGAPRNGESSSVRQSRAALDIDPGEETERERKRRLIREGFAR
ncbi:MAG: hypothetical protein PIR02_11845 [Microbacterium enclense]